MTDRDEKRTPSEAEDEKFHAEAKAATALALKYGEESRKAGLEANIMEFALNKEKRSEETSLAGDYFHHVYNFFDVVNEHTVENCMQTLGRWSRMKPGQALELVINSPGGNIFEGFALYHYIQSLRRRGHHITTRCLGMAASMGGILLQAGTLRQMGAESYILIHEISSITIGKTGDMEDEMSLLKMAQDRILDIFTERSQGKVTKAKLQSSWKRRDWWLSSKDALKLGIVDEVV